MEKFCQGLARGMTATRAYSDAGFAGDRRQASKERTKPDNAARVAEIRAAAAAASNMNRDEALRILAECARGQQILSTEQIQALKLWGSWTGQEKGTVAENKAADGLHDLVARLTHA